MATNQTAETSISVSDFIDSYVGDEQKKKDSFSLIELMQEWSGCKPRMWGPTIIGFGNYHYKYASGHEGDAPLIGFSPRKAALSLYVYSPTDESKQLLEALGKYSMGKSCIYVKKLSNINIGTLEKLCRSSIAYTQEHHECGCRI